VERSIVTDRLALEAGVDPSEVALSVSPASVVIVATIRLPNEDTSELLANTLRSSTLSTTLRTTQFFENVLTITSVPAVQSTTRRVCIGCSPPAATPSAPPSSPLTGGAAALSINADDDVNDTLTVVAIVIAVLLGLAALAVGGYFVFGPPSCFGNADDDFSDTSSVEKGARPIVAASQQGYGSPYPQRYEQEDPMYDEYSPGQLYGEPYDRFPPPEDQLPQRALPPSAVWPTLTGGSEGPAPLPLPMPTVLPRPQPQFESPYAGAPWDGTSSAGPPLGTPSSCASGSAYGGSARQAANVPSAGVYRVDRGATPGSANGRRVEATYRV